MRVCDPGPAAWAPMRGAADAAVWDLAGLRGAVRGVGGEGGDMTTVQQLAMAIVMKHGRIIRSRGGFWHAPDAVMSVRGVPDVWVGTETVKALARRGLLELVALRPGWFPVEAKAVPGVAVDLKGRFETILARTEAKAVRGEELSILRETKEANDE